MTIYHNVYPYDASVAAAVLFTILFFILSIIHLYQLLRTRTWYLLPFLIGGIFEGVGYAFRTVSIKQSPDYTLPPYAIQLILPLIAPALLSATMYMSLGRIILVTQAEAVAPIRRTWLTKLFVTGDILSFLAQALGGAILAQQKASSYNTGRWIIIVGLVIQVLFFGLFLITSVMFHVRLNKMPTLASQKFAWKRHLSALYAGSALILVRSIYRLIEYLEDAGGYLITHEAFAYVFDALLMFAVMIVFCWVHPSEIQALIRGKGKAIKHGFKVVHLNETEDGTVFLSSMAQAK
ncbi:RTA1 like protein [Aureobasidium pullulans]|uniref:RTA1 like protein n=1 Tax=Aureobasidium pullulans TaxID=5580 RepID=A0A4V4JWP5_AURPU|nr:RTA1 like protein [Aureobasidium pullulans]